MSLTETIRSQFNVSLKERNEVKKSILRVVLGDLSTLESRSGKKASDEEVKRVLKKIVEGNTETLQYLKPEHPSYVKLTAENHILNSLLPKSLSKQEIKEALSDLLEEIKSAKSDGQATGMAMKFLKQAGKEVDGNTVSETIKEVRSE